MRFVSPASPSSPLRAPVLRPDQRPSALAALGLAGAALVVLTAWVLVRGRTPGLNNLDAPLRAHVGTQGVAVHVARTVGSREALAIVALASQILGLMSRHVRFCALGAVAPAVAATITEHLLKPFVSSHAPFNSHPGFPSGTTTGAVAVLLVVGVGKSLVLRQDWLSARRATNVGLAVIALVVCVGVVASSAHNTAAVLGGALVAVVCVLLTALLGDHAVEYLLAISAPESAVPDA